jgi:hypothetical protein
MTQRITPPIVSGQFAKLVVRGTLIQNAGTFPEQSPTAIKENPIFRRVFDQALKDDPTFANEVQRLIIKEAEGQEMSGIIKIDSCAACVPQPFVTASSKTAFSIAQYPLKNSATSL